MGPQRSCRPSPTNGVGVLRTAAQPHDLRKAVLAVVLRAIFGFQQRRAKRYGHRDARCGSITSVQRFGSAINLNVHFHALIPDGVWVWSKRFNTPQFVQLPSPSTADIQRLVVTIARRIRNVLERWGLLYGELLWPLRGAAMLPERGRDADDGLLSLC